MPQAGLWRLPGRDLPPGSYHVLADSCPDGPCSRFHLDEETDDVIVQAYLTDQKPVAPPEGEGFLRIPAAQWRILLAALRT